MQATISTVQLDVSQKEIDAIQFKIRRQEQSRKGHRRFNNPVCIKFEGE